VFGRAPAPPNQLWSCCSTNLQLHRGAGLSLWNRRDVFGRVSNSNFEKCLNGLPSFALKFFPLCSACCAWCVVLCVCVCVCEVCACAWRVCMCMACVHVCSVWLCMGVCRACVPVYGARVCDCVRVCCCACVVCVSFFSFSI
jgi:hypothetical protein